MSKMKYRFPDFSEVDPHVRSVKEISQVFRDCGFKFPIDDYHTTKVRPPDSNGWKSIEFLGNISLLVYFIKPSLELAFVVKKVNTPITNTNDIMFHNEYGPSSIIQDKGKLIKIYYIDGFSIGKNEFFRKHALKQRIESIKNDDAKQ